MIDMITGLIGSFLYPMFSIIFILIDVLQYIYGAFAGIEDVRYGRWAGSGVDIGSGNTGAENDTGIVYYLITSPLIRNIFFSILTLAIFLIIVFTVMAFIKNAYSSKQKKWQDIIVSALKGLANFIFVPVCCFLGVWLSNILLVAINGATSASGNGGLSGNLFVAAAYNANMVRTQSSTSAVITLPFDEKGGWGGFQIRKEYFTPDYHGTEEHTKSVTNLNAFIKANWKGDNAPKAIEGQDQYYYADIIDSVYGQQFALIWNSITVEGCYHLFEINYLTLIVAGVFIIYSLVYISFGMVKRLFMLLFLFVISPGMCAMYPLDDGSALGKWKGDFIKNLLSAYGAVVGMNLFFALLPIIQNIQLTGNISTMLLFSGFLHGLIPLLLMICGLFVVKDLISMFSGYIGAGNAMEEGKSLAGSVKNKIKETGKKVAGFTGTAVGAFGRAYAANKKDKANNPNHHKGRAGAASFFGDLGKGLAHKSLDSIGMGDLFTGEKGKNIVGTFKDAADAKTKEFKFDNETAQLFRDLKEALAREGGGGTAGYKFNSKWGADTDKIIAETKERGVYEKAAKAAGVDPTFLESNRELTKGVKEAAKTFEEAIEALNQWREENGAENVSGTAFNSGNLYTNAEIQAETDKDKREEMKVINESIKQYRSLSKSLDEAQKGLQKISKTAVEQGVDQKTGHSGSGVSGTMIPLVAGIIKAASENSSGTAVNASTLTASELSASITQITNRLEALKDAEQQSAKAIQTELATNSATYEKLAKKSDKK